MVGEIDEYHKDVIETQTWKIDVIETQIWKITPPTSMNFEFSRVVRYDR